MFRRVLTYALLIGLLAACDEASPAAPPPVVDPAAQTGAPIVWERDSRAIVFRADRLGGDPASPPVRSAIPDCTVYGDNRVVWVNPLGAWETEILIDRLSDDAIFSFIDTLTVSGRIYTYQLPTADPAAPTPEPEPFAVRETLTLAVSGIPHTTDERSGWSADYYELALDVCRTLSSTPVLFEPLDGLWLSTIVVPYSEDVGLTWDAAANGVPLAEAVSAPRWVTGEPALRLWRYQRTQPAPLTINEGTVSYQIVLQVPGISRTAPDAP